MIPSLLRGKADPSKRAGALHIWGCSHDSMPSWRRVMALGKWLRLLRAHPAKKSQACISNKLEKPAVTLKMASGEKKARKGCTCFLFIFYSMSQGNVV
jgi:hypothetical protein